MMTIMYAKYVPQLLGETITDSVLTQPIPHVRVLCYDLLPVQYTDLTH